MGILSVHHVSRGVTLKLFPFTLQQDKTMTHMTSSHEKRADVSDATFGVFTTGACLKHSEFVKRGCCLRDHQDMNVTPVQRAQCGCSRLDSYRTGHKREQDCRTVRKACANQMTTLCIDTMTRKHTLSQELPLILVVPKPNE